MAGLVETLRKLVAVKATNSMYRLGIHQKEAQASLEALKNEYQANVGERATMDKRYERIVSNLTRHYNKKFEEILQEEQKAQEDEVSLITRYAKAREVRTGILKVKSTNGRESVLHKVKGAIAFIQGDTAVASERITRIKEIADLRDVQDSFVKELDKELEAASKEIKQSRTKQKDTRAKWRDMEARERRDFKRLEMSNFTSKSVAKQMPLHRRIFGKILGGLLGKQPWKTKTKALVDRAVKFGTDEILPAIGDVAVGIAQEVGATAQSWEQSARSAIEASKQRKQNVVDKLDASLTAAEKDQVELKAKYNGKETDGPNSQKAGGDIDK